MRYNWRDKQKNRFDKSVIEGDIVDDVSGRVDVRNM